MLSWHKLKYKTFFGYCYRNHLFANANSRDNRLVWENGLCIRSPKIYHQYFFILILAPSVGLNMSNSHPNLECPISCLQSQFMWTTAVILWSTWCRHSKACVGWSRRRTVHFWLWVAVHWCAVDQQGLLESDETCTPNQPNPLVPCAMQLAVVHRLRNYWLQLALALIHAPQHVSLTKWATQHPPSAVFWMILWIISIWCCFFLKNTFFLLQFKQISVSFLSSDLFNTPLAYYFPMFCSSKSFAVLLNNFPCH